MSIRMGEHTTSTNTNRKNKNSRVFPVSITMETTGENHTIICREYDIPSNIQTRKEAHIYIQNILGSEYRLRLDWFYINHNFKIAGEFCSTLRVF